MPIKKYGFALDKQWFWDCIYLRYHILLQRIPTTCSCGIAFNVQHALMCAKGGFIINRHNELRDLTAEILDEIWNDAKIEPLLQPLNGEIFSRRSTIRTDDARADVAARGVWTRGKMAYDDVRVFNPLAKCHQNQTLQDVHRKKRKRKKNEPITIASSTSIMGHSHLLSFLVMEECRENVVGRFYLFIFFNIYS